MPTRVPFYPHSPGARPSQVSSSVLATNYLPKRKVAPPGAATGSGTTTDTGYTTTVDVPGRWDMPDYEALLAADPTVADTNARIGHSGENAATERAAAIQQAVIRAGFAPSGFGNRYGDITGATLAAAGSNPNSTLAGLQLTRNRGSADLAAALAARGGVYSGAMNAGEQRVLEGFQSGQASAADQLLSSLGGYEGSYASALDQLAAQREEALRQARLAIAQMYPPTWIDPTTTTTTIGPPDPTPPYTPLPPGPVAPADIPPNYPGDIYYLPDSGIYQTGRPIHGIGAV